MSNPEKRLAWNFFLYPAGGTEVQPLRGVFWLPNHKADGFVAIQNVSEENVRVEPTFHAAGTKHGLEPVYLAAGQGLKLDLRRELRKLGLNKSDAGGLELAYSGPPGALRAHGVLFDGRGFSTEIDFLAYGEAAEPRTFAYRTPRFAIGTADPKLGLPRRTSFQSYLVLHNFNGYLHDLDIFVAGQQGNDLREVKRSVSLPAGETRVLDVAKEFPELKALKTAWASMEVSYTGRHNGVGMMLASVSDSGEYSIRSVLNWVQASTREGWIWRADANQNTLLGIYNADSEPAPVNLSIDYHSGGQRSSYDMPLTIPPRASELLDIGQIISEGQPDSDGDVIPQAVTFGGYRAVKSGPRANVTIVTEALIYDRKGRDFLTIYNTGCCHSAVTFRTQNVTGAAGQTSQLLWEGHDVCLNDWVNITSQASFSTTDSSIATFTSTHGQLLLQGAGTTTVNTQLFYFRETFMGECNGLTEFSSCTVAVRPKVDAVGPSKGPVGHVITVHIFGEGFGNNPSVNAGSGIAVTVDSATNTEIEATFNIAAAAPGGNHQVIVTASGKSSIEPVSFFVQIPTSISMITPGQKVTYNGNDMIECDGTNDGPRWGYSRCLTYRLMDQASNPIQSANYTAMETFEAVSSNPQGIGHTSANNGLAENGTFDDFLAFVTLSSPPPEPGMFIKEKQTFTIRNNQTGTDYVLRKNCLHFQHSDVTVTDITTGGTCQ